jgi:hypothetical protein
LFRKIGLLKCYKYILYAIGFSERRNIVGVPCAARYAKYNLAYRVEWKVAVFVVRVSPSVLARRILPLSQNTGVTVYPTLPTVALASRVFLNIIEIIIAREVREILPAVIEMSTVVVGGAVALPNAAVVYCVNLIS